MSRPMPGPPMHDLMSWPHVGALKHCDLCVVERRMDGKRLTREGCAAHYWQAMHNVLRYGDGDPGQNKAIRRAATWDRFRTYPHALEATP